MSLEGSITHWIAKAKVGDPDATRQLWDRFFDELVVLARNRLDARTRRAVDEEDIALSAFASFFDAAQAGRFPNVNNRDDLRRLLMRMTVRKAIDQHRHAQRAKRGGSAVRGDSAFVGDQGMDEVMESAPTPELAVIIAEECERLFQSLGDAKLQAVAVARMQGHTNDEIAQRQSCSTRTVERQLRLIRKKWESFVQS